MDPLNRPRKPFGLGTYLLLMLGVGVVAGLAGAAQAIWGDRGGPLGLVISAATLSVALAIAFAACIWWWRGIDEAAREAHKWAWWWGGSGGMTIGLVILTLLSVHNDGPVPAEVDLSANDLIGAGMMAILLFQLAGYSVAWAVWWLKHR